METARPITETQIRIIKPFLRLFTRLHVYLYKMFGGKLFHSMGGGEICIVRMRGAKSGAVKDFPLMYVPYKDGIVLVASLAGAPKHPVWYHNLVKNPEFDVTVGRETRRLVARVASASEKAEVWPLCCQVYPDFRLYQSRTTRDIPVFICEPVNGAA